MIDDPSRSLVHGLYSSAGALMQQKQQIVCKMPFLLHEHSLAIPLPTV